VFWNPPGVRERRRVARKEKRANRTITNHVYVIYVGTPGNINCRKDRLCIF